MNPLVKQAILDSGASPVMWGGLGGLGGYAAGKAILDPYYDWRENRLEDQIASKERTLESIKGRRSMAPIIAAAVGALLLAAVASKKAKEKERDRMSRMTAMGAHPEMGVGAGDVVPFRQDAAFYN